MIIKPRVLLLDEPTEGIQPNKIQQIGRMISLLRAKGDMTIVLVGQAFDFAYGLADSFYVFERGRVTTQGRKDTLTREQVRLGLPI